MLHSPVSPTELNSAAEYLASTGGAGDVMQWVIIWAALICGVLYLVRYRNGEHEVSEDLKKFFGKKKGSKKDGEAVGEETPEEVEEEASSGLTAAEVEALVDRRVAEALVSVAPAMPASAPTVSIPQQRVTSPVVSVEKAPEAPLEDDEDELEEEEGEGLNESVSAPVAPQRLRLPEAPKVVQRAPSAQAPQPKIVKDDEPLIPTEEEKRLMAALEPEAWEKAAFLRKLGGTVIEEFHLTKAGIIATVRLDGEWTVPIFQKKEDSVRTLLAVEDDMMTAVLPSGKAGWASLHIRSRSACADFIPWYPGAPLGFCTVTGKEIRISFRRHLAIAGASDMGKSVTARTLFADICADAAACLIYCDPKMVEGALWEGRARVALDHDEIAEVAVELEGEYERRKRIMKQRGWDSWQASPEDPVLIVPIDEGADLIAQMSDPSLDKDEKITYKKTVAIFTRGARAWRAVGIYIYWMTQYPTVKEGMPSQIGANLQDRISMPLSMETHSAVVFGDEGVADGWKAHQLPRSPKGRALVKVGPGATSNPVQVVYLDKEQIPTLPLSGIWYPSGVKYATPITNEPEVLDASATQYGPADGETRVAVNETETTLVTPDGETVVVETPAEELSPEDKVLVALLDSPSGVLTFAELMAATGISKSTLHRLLTDKMVPENRVVKGGHNEWKLA